MQQAISGAAPVVAQDGCKNVMGPNYAPPPEKIEYPNVLAVNFHINLLFFELGRPHESTIIH